MHAVVQHPFIAFLCVFAPLIMAQRSAREFPKNMILTFLFTFVEGIFIAPFLYIAERSAPGVVGQAGVLTFVAFGVLTLYALLSRRDFSAWGSFFMVGLRRADRRDDHQHVRRRARRAGMWIAAIGVLIFSGLLVFDTWRIAALGQLGQDDYVLAAVSIYLDLLNMFMFILSAVGRRNRRR